MKWLAVLFTLIPFTSCLSFPLLAATTPCALLAKQNTTIPNTTSQMIVLTTHSGFQAEMTACQRHDRQWHQVSISPMPAVIGKHGLAALGEKREKDQKTPRGLYPLGEAFGSEPLALKMDFRYLSAEDKYIDDPHSKNYNQWVRGKTEAKSYETMLIDPYRMGVVINYNKKPTIPGAGSAIFIHLWHSPSTPTHGCIATDENHLVSLLHWLDKKQHPFIWIR